MKDNDKTTIVKKPLRVYKPKVSRHKTIVCATDMVHFGG